nr:reverse transcriptase domain-containing protein [Tanacetum cinerariifolium]
MTEMLRAPTEGCAEAIVVPPILAEQFELKHSLINMMTSEQFFGLEKDNPHDHIRCSEIVKLTHAVNQQTSSVTTAMTAMLKQLQANPPPAQVKAVEEICVTCGGAHPCYQCLAAGGNTFPEFRDNIQGYVSAAAGNYNQGNLGYRPQGVANQKRPLGSGSLPGNIVANPKGELKAITTRNGLATDGPTVSTPPKSVTTEEDESDFVVVDYESDPRVSLILGRPFLRTARALIDVHGEEMILRDEDERLTLNMKHDTASYSNHPHRDSVNLINIFNIPSEDCLEVLVSNKQSGNPTFSLHKEITSRKVTHELHDSKGCNFLSEELPDIDSFNDIHPHFDDDPLSGSTTYSSNSLLEEFTDEVALITYPPDYDDNLTCDIKSDLREIEFLLYQEIESDAANFYDDLFDSKGEKIKEAELLMNQLDLPCDILSEYDSFASQDFSRDDDLPSPDNKDKVFNPGILIHEKLVKIITRVAQEKKLAVSYASLVFEDFDPPIYELLVFKEVPNSMRLLPFSFENKEKVFKPRIYTYEKVHFCILPELSHPGYHFKVNLIFISLIDFSCSKWKEYSSFGCSYVPSLSPLIHSSMGELGPALRP